MKPIIITLTSLFLLPLFLLPAFAGEAEAPHDPDGQYGDIGAYDAFALLDDETKRLLQGIGADLSVPSSAADISPSGVFRSAKALFEEGLTGSVKHLSVLLGMILILSAASHFLPRKEDGVLSMLPLFCFAAVELPAAAELTGGVLSAVETVSAFTKLLIPVMGVTTAASGAPVSSAALTAASLGAAEAVGSAVDHLFVPLTGAFGAVCVMSAADGAFSLDRGARLLKKVFTTLLGGAALLFSGVLAIRGTAARAADSLSMKGAKFLIGGLVPVVGGAMSDGLGTVAASLNAVNDTAGALGIAAIAFVLLPPLIRVLTHRAALWCASLAGELAGSPRAAAYLSGISELLRMLNVLLLFDGFVFICALGMLIGAS